MTKDVPGEIGLPAKRAVELGRMANAFVDGEPEIAGADHNVINAGLDGFCRKLLPGLRGGKCCLGLAIVGAYIFPASRAGRKQAVPRREPARLLVDRGDRELRKDADAGLLDAAAAAAHKQLFFAHHPKARAAKIRARLQCCGVDPQQLGGLLFNRNRERVFRNRHDPLVLIGGDVLQHDGPGLQ